MITVSFPLMLNIIWPVALLYVLLSILKHTVNIKHRQDLTGAEVYVTSYQPSYTVMQHSYPEAAAEVKEVRLWQEGHWKLNDLNVKLPLTEALNHMLFTRQQQHRHMVEWWLCLKIQHDISCSTTLKCVKDNRIDSAVPPVHHKTDTTIKVRKTNVANS